MNEEAPELPPPVVAENPDVIAAEAKNPEAIVSEAKNSDAIVAEAKHPDTIVADKNWISDKLLQIIIYHSYKILAWNIKMCELLKLLLLGYFRETFSFKAPKIPYR